MMAKKGAGFRLWFRKLSIKRFHTIATQRKRRSSPHHHHPHGVQISSPYRTLNSDSNPSSPASGHSPSVMISSSSSPQNMFVAFSPSPWRHSFPALSPISHTSPCTSPTPPRRSSGAARHGSSAASRKPQYLATSAAAVLLSPFNRKAMDIAFPSGGSSPATFLQSPLLLQAVPILASPARILSPPLSSTRSHTILFRSPLHPLAQPTLGIAKNEAQSSSKQLNTTQSLDGSRREAKVSVSSSRKPKISSSSSRSKSDAAACNSQAQYERASYLTESTKHNSSQQMPIRASSTRPSPLIVDCGCRPSLSSSFRKTKKTLQACGSCSSNNHGVIPGHDLWYEQAMRKLRSLRDGVSAEESKNSSSTAACIGCQEETCILFPKQAHHSHGAFSHKMLQQLRKRKKNTNSVMNNSPIKSLNPHAYCAHIITPSNLNREGIGNGSKVKSGSPPKDGALFTDTQTLPWDKEFSSFTSEDTFFSSFERSRPSFSSNSSSECFDKKLRHSNLALSTAAAILVSKIPETPKHMHGNPESNTCNFQNGMAGDQDVKSKPGNPLIEVSFHSQVNEDKGASKHGFMAPSCRVVSSERRMSSINPKPGAKRSCLNPLVGIKEVSCEEGNISTPEQGNLRTEGCNSNIEFLNMQKKSSPSPAYIFSSHSDYYATARARSTKNVRVRKKSRSVNVVQGAGDDIGSARVRRRAQLQAKWMLSDERIQWQSSVDESEVDAASNGDFNGGDAARSPSKHVCESPIGRERSVGQERGLKLDASKEVASVAQATPASNVSESDCDGGKETSASEHANAADTQSSSAKKSRLMDGVAVVKSSRDPLVDFRDSMVDMIIESQIYTAEDLGELLRCFLSLNPSEHHDTIVRAFMQVWAKFFQGT